LPRAKWNEEQIIGILKQVEADQPNGERVVRVLERLKETRGLPTVIQTDNGPEFTGHALDRVPFGRWLTKIG